MKKLLILLFLTSNALAFKVGYINIDTLLSQSKEFTDTQKIIATEFKAKDDKLTKKAQYIETLLKKFQENKDDLSSKEKQEKITKIRELDNELKTEAAKTKKQFELRNTEELQKIQNKINTTIKEFAKTHKFDLILYKDIAYIDDKHDITNKISNLLNK